MEKCGKILEKLKITFKMKNTNFFYVFLFSKFISLLDQVLIYILTA